MRHRFLTMSAQIQDYVRLDGKTCRIAGELDLPESAPALVYLTGKKYIKPCSACWRGYIGFWEISNDRLFLRKVIGNAQGRFRPPLFAGWYSGTIRVRQGKLLRYVYNEFDSVYERERVIEIQSGRVIGRQIVSQSNEDRSGNSEKGSSYE